MSSYGAAYRQVDSWLDVDWRRFHRLDRAFSCPLINRIVTMFDIRFGDGTFHPFYYESLHS
jgi:hypothetical protein